MSYRRWWLLLIAIPLFGVPILSRAQDAVQPSTCVVTSNNIAKSDNPVIPFNPEIDIPGILTLGNTITGASIGQYLRVVYIFFVWIVGLLGVVMIIYGGIRWVAAAGNPSRISSARETVQNAVAGVVLALLSVVLLNTINPNLTNFTSLSLQSVSACDLNFISDVVKEAGPMISQCSAKVASGPDDIYCTKAGCKAGLNDMINRSASNPKYNVDPVLIKALVNIEAPRKDGHPMSGPTLGKESATSNRRGSAYGFGQIVAKSLAGYAKAAEVILPAPCQVDVAKLRKSTGELIDACADALDANPQLQFDLIAGGLRASIDSNQLRNEPAVLAMAWHLGQQGAINFYDGSGKLPESRAGAVNYLKIFNSSYTKMCNTATQFLHQGDIPGKL